MLQLALASLLLIPFNPTAAISYNPLTATSISPTVQLNYKPVGGDLQEATVQLREPSEYTVSLPTWTEGTPVTPETIPFVSVLASHNADRPLPPPFVALVGRFRLPAERTPLELTRIVGRPEDAHNTLCRYVSEPDRTPGAGVELGVSFTEENTYHLRVDYIECASFYINTRFQDELRSWLGVAIDTARA